jgi:DNA-binding response OmpR family regulator
VNAATLANVVDAALVRAARRFGVVAAAPTPSAPRPFEALIERLGIARPAEVLWRVGDRSFLRARADAPPASIACTVDMDERAVELPTGASLNLPEQRIQLLVALAESGAGGATLEELFALVWRGAFHPLRHRNAVYVALTRLKDSLRPFTRDVRLAHDGERYRLVGPAPVAVRRRVTPSEVAALVKDGFGPQVHDD